jgi:succinate dehydrogenase / fumarate reductase flavoprotein subunit
MKIYPAVHYTMGGLWVDYNLQSTVPGLFVLGEANFSDHGANRLGASALMQGLADGYFVIPYTIGDHLARTKFSPITEDHPACKDALVDARNWVERLLSVNGSRTVDSFHRALGKIMWDKCGMGRTADGLREAIGEIRTLRDEFWNDVKVVGGSGSYNQNLEHAGRVADFLEFGELLCADALNRNESCGGHFREEYQTPDGEALRDDENYSYVAAWRFNGVGEEETLHKEPLKFENVKLATRSYQ